METTTIKLGKQTHEVSKPIADLFEKVLFSQMEQNEKRQ